MVTGDAWIYASMDMIAKSKEKGIRVEIAGTKEDILWPTSETEQNNEIYYVEDGRVYSVKDNNSNVKNIEELHI